VYLSSSVDFLVLFVIFPSLFYRKIVLDVKLFFVYLFIVYLPSSLVFLVLFGIFSCLFYTQIM